MTERTIDLAKLSEPFPAEDIEWRVARAGLGKNKIWCACFAYVTARAIQSRLDDVCGPANWRNEPPQIHQLNDKVTAFVVGISIRTGGEWITKWDCSEVATSEAKGTSRIDPAKSTMSSATKRAATQWGIFRYGYYLEEMYAETNDTGGKGWNWAKLPDKVGGAEYYWKPPTLPAWALPKEKEHEIAQADLDALKKSWRATFAADTKNPADLREGFARFVVSVVGEFPQADYTCWTREALERVQQRINAPSVPGVSSDVPFDQ